MSNDTSIAIIGIAGRFPKASTLDDFWENLSQGREGITFFTDAELLAAGVDRADIDHPEYVKARALLEDVDLFDAEFFGYSSREAQWMDPQQRLFLEQAHLALEHAGYACGDQPLNVGVFAGCSVSSYLLSNLLPSGDIDAGVGNMQVMIGNDKDYLASRTSYKLNLTGPSLTIQTACSTSLTAVHVACQSLLGGECGMALAGGSCVSLPQISGYLYQEGSIASPDGHCRPFDAKAKGTNGGSGVGVVLLKRLEEALADGDSIYAVIRGSAINNDGTDKVGFTAPSQNGQAAVIAEALALSDVDASEIGYIEAHGTATPVGDPIEVAALTQVFQSMTDKKNFCAIGSVKSNLGHLDAAAGIAGLLKTVLALKHRQIPASLNFTQPNPKIKFEQSPFYVPTSTIDWPSQNQLPRRAGVSSFGIGGSNVHVVLEEHLPELHEQTPGPHLLVFSARSASALSTMRENFARFLEKNTHTNLADAAHTLQVGRQTFQYRQAIVVSDIADAIHQLRMPYQPLAATSTGIALLFTGQGVPILNTGRALYEEVQFFRAIVDDCSRWLEPHLHISLADLIYPAKEDEPKSTLALADTRFAQPALLIVEYALTRLLQHCGIAPQALLGHSLGQYCAAVIAGILPIYDALTLVARRGALMQALESGGMVSVQLSEEDALVSLKDTGIDLAAVNSPDSCVIAGLETQLDQLEMHLETKGIGFKRSSVNRAFHSAMTDTCLNDLVTAFSETTCQSGDIPVLCNVSGDWLSDEEACNPSYWAKHTRATVRFADCLQTLSKQSDLQWLEVGPAPILAGLVKRNQFSDPVRPVPTFKGQGKQDLLASLGHLWQSGLPLHWDAISELLHGPIKLRRVALPTYPFERKRYWIEAQPTSTSKTTATREPHSSMPALARDQLVDALYIPKWIRSDPVKSENVFSNVLFFDPQTTLSNAILAGLAQHDIDVVAVRDLQQLDAITTREWDAIIYAWPLKHQGHKFDSDALENSFYALMECAQVFSQSMQNQSASLIILTTHCANPLANDPVDPYQAAVLGAAREIPKEVSWLNARCIDIASDIPASEVISEIFDRRGDFAVALRHEQRFHWSIEPLKNDWMVHALPLKNKAVYWIVGGTGGVGMTIARFLAKHYQSRLVISSRHAGLISSDADALPKQWLQKKFRTLEKKNHITTVLQREGLNELLSLYSASLVWDYFSSSSLHLKPGESVSLAELQKSLEIQSGYVKFLNFMVDLIVRNGLAAHTDGGITIQAIPEAPSKVHNRILESHPEFKGMVDFMQYCASHYYQVLSGETSGVGVLYPDGSATKMLEAVSNTAEHSCIRTQLDLLSEWSRKVAKENTGQPLRILEVGGGHGMLTNTVLNEIGDAEYYFTDIGKSFVDARIKKTKESGEERVVCKVLDISRDPLTQGFTPAQFDWVLAMNVVHATPDIGETLRQIRSLLKPGGSLILVETVRQEDWVDIVWGLTPGWWAFRDHEIRTSSPLLSTDQWRDVLTKNGFDHFFSTSDAESKHDASLMIARSDQTIETVNHQTQSKLDELKALGADVLFIPADAGDESSMQSALHIIDQRYGALDGIIHCGMVLEDSPLTSKTRAQASRVLRPKVAGIQVLDKILGAKRLDFLALFSSLSSIDPGPGQFDYAAANAVIDAYARSCPRDTLPVVSINWNRWRESGFVARLNEAHQQADAPVFKRFLLDTGSQWTLSEHRIHDDALLPGTALIEYIVRAAPDPLKSYPIQIDHLQYVAPCWVQDSVQQSLLLQFRQKQDKNHFDFECKLDDEITPKTIGTLSKPERIHPVHHDLQSWKDQCTFDIGQITPESESLTRLGPRWQCLNSAKFNADQTRAIGHIVLSDAFLSDLDEHPLHPALLDVASGFCCSGAYLPFGMERLIIHDKLPASFFSLVNIQSQNGHPFLNIDLVNEEGGTILSIEGYLLRPLRSRFALRQSRQGQIETLSCVEVQPPELQPDEVEIEVIAAGLNFKDVLLASGLMPSGLDQSAELRIFGAECAGRIKRTGHRAQLKWHIGDEVIATAPGALAEYVVVADHQVFSKPAGMSFADASSIPVAFATAYFALHTLGRIQPGQRVLIHSATGGVGLAALQIARLAGAEIFATAGNDAKRKYLLDMGIPHVMDSRSLAFAGQIRTITQNQGVDLALNALSGDQLLATLDVVAKNGIFLELGKRDILAGTQLPLSFFDKGIGFFAIDFTPEHHAYSAVMHDVLEQFERGALKPLPRTLYSLNDASEAFQYMLESRHIGKIILAPEPSLAVETGGVSTTVPRHPHDTGISDGLSDEQGWKVFTLALQSKQTQIAVIPPGTDVSLSRSVSALAQLEESQTFDHSDPQETSGQSSVLWESPTQKKLAGIWQAVLGQEITRSEDNFFELRGDSLLAISVLAKVRQQFGVALEPSALFTSPTLRELAIAIDQKKSPSETTDEAASIPVKVQSKAEPVGSTAPALPGGIVPLNRGGTRTPLFLAPPIMGTLFPYVQFAQLLGKDQPVYGLAPRVDQKGVPVWKTMQEQAAFYVEDILRAQPKGPYQLAGWSFGASVAFEVARQLEAGGHKVGFFAAIDYPAQGSAQSSMLDFVRFFGASTLKNLASYLRDYMYLRQKTTDPKKSSWMGNIVENAVISKIITPEAQEIFTNQPNLPELMQVYRGNASALATYRPGRTYKGKIDLFRTEDHNMKRHNNTLEWETMTHGRVQVHKIGGTHMTILRTPYVEKLAESIKTRLK